MRWILNFGANYWNKHFTRQRSFWSDSDDSYKRIIETLSFKGPTRKPATNHTRMDTTGKHPFEWNKACLCFLLFHHNITVKSASETIILMLLLSSSNIQPPNGNRPSLHNAPTAETKADVRRITSLTSLVASAAIHVISQLILHHPLIRHVGDVGMLEEIFAVGPHMEVFVQALLDEVLEARTPLPWLQLRRRIPHDEEKRAHRMHVGQRRLAFGHFNASDPQGPEVGAGIVGRAGILLAGNHLGSHPEKRKVKRWKFWMMIFVSLFNH